MANIASKLPFWNRHLRDLARKTDVLDLLNSGWDRYNVERQIDVHYVTGGEDQIVDATSAAPSVHGENVSYLPQCDHFSVVRPTPTNVLSYAVLHRFLSLISSMEGDALRNPLLAPDPLFDIFNPPDNEFYQERAGYDNTIARNAFQSPVWVFGESGVGKTTLLRRSIFSASMKLRHIMLSGYSGKECPELVRSLLVEAIQLEGFEPSNKRWRECTGPELVQHLKRAVIDSIEKVPRCFLVEEIPLHDPAALLSFVVAMVDLTTQLQSDGNVAGMIRFAFASISDPTIHFKGANPKMSDRIQFLSLARWEEADLTALLKRIALPAGVSLDAPEGITIVKHANGLPRFVKLILRDIRNRPGEATSLRIKRLLDAGA